MGAQKAKERRPRAESLRGTISRHLLLDRRFLVVAFGTTRSDRYPDDLNCGFESEPSNFEKNALFYGKPLKPPKQRRLIRRNTVNVVVLVLSTTDLFAV